MFRVVQGRPGRLQIGRHKRLYAMGFVLFALLGCGRTGASVTGTVTFEGKEVDKGFITFFPFREQKDTKGAEQDTKGAEIIGGKYHVVDLPPGKKRVFIKASPKPHVGEGKVVKLLPPEHPIPSNAAGNNQIVDVVGGSQVHDFHLHKAKD